MRKLNLSTPSRLAEFLARKREEEKQSHLNAVMRREKDLLRRAAVDRLRIERFEELWKAAGFLFDWADWAAENGRVQELFSVIGDDRRLLLYRKPFKNGEPVTDGDRAANARLWLQGNPRTGDGPVFGYEEYRNSPQGSHASVRLEFHSVSELLSGVHPEFLLGAYALLCGHDAWKFILEELGLSRSGRIK